MPHWSDQYLGKPYVPGSYDCAHLAIEVAQREFRFHTRLPTQNYQAARRELGAATELLAEYGVRTEAPIDGDAVIIRNPAGRWHIGIFFRWEHQHWVLHNLMRLGVCRHRIRQLPNLNMAVEGYYQWAH